MSKKERDLGSGIGMLGSIIAVAISWSCNHSIGWAFLHGIAGWLFIIWWCFWGEAPL
jgi:hypothetical protein